MSTPRSRRALSVGFVWTAVVVFAAANAVVRLLSELGAQNPIDGRNPISFCNVLFVGNVCAFFVLVPLFRRHWTKANLAKVRPGDWGAMVLLAILSGALAPSFLFLALENTSATNVVLLGRIEPLLFLAMSAVLLRDRVDAWTGAGVIIAACGAALVIVLDAKSSLMFGKGEWQAAAGAALLAVSSIISRKRLKTVPIGIFAVVRTGLGAVIFYIAASYLFGPFHFIDAFSPFVWQWMAVFGAVIVAGGQYFWFKGLQACKAGEVSLATSFSPFAGVLFAVLLLDEAPTMALYIGGAIMLTGIVVGQVGLRRRKAEGDAWEASMYYEREGNVNFRGI